MCGIVGYWDPSGVDESIANRMASQISYRGPDDVGIWLDHNKSIALAHRRLSIIDLSKLLAKVGGSAA